MKISDYKVLIKNPDECSTDEYFQSMSYVTLYAETIRQSWLQSCSTDEWYDGVVNSYHEMQSHAAEWFRISNDMHLSLSDLDIERETVYQAFLTIKSEIRNWLEATGPDMQDKRQRHQKNIKVLLTDVKNCFSGRGKLFLDIINRVEDCRINFQNDLVFVSNTLKDAVSQERICKADIKEIEKEIQALESQISSIQIASASCVLGGLVCGGIAGAILFFVPGSRWGFGFLISGIVCEVTAGGLEIANCVKESELKRKEAERQSELDDKKNLLAAIVFMEATFENIQAHSGNLVNELQNVNGAWGQMQAYSEEIIAFLLNPSEAVTEENMQALEKNMYLLSQDANNYYNMGQEMGIPIPVSEEYQKIAC